jgi:predicted secreted protein
MFFMLLLACTPDPSLVLAVPDGPLFGEVPVTLSGAADELAIFADGQSIGGGKGPSLSVVWDTRMVVPGTHVLRGSGWVGSEEFQVQQEVEVEAGDLTAPVVSFTSPDDGEEVESLPLTVAFSVEEEDALASVRLLDGDTLLQELATVGPWTVELTDLDGGNHTLTAEATDLSGNVGTDAVAVHYGLTCEISAPRNQEAVSGVVPVKVEARSPGSEVASVTLTVDQTEIGTDTERPYTFEWDSSGFSGQATLKVLAVAADGEECSSGIRVLVGADVFSVILTAPMEAEVLTGTVGVKAAIGGGGGADYAELYVDDSLVERDDDPDWAFNLDTTAWTDGDHRIKVVGYEVGTGATAEDEVGVSFLQ